VRLSPKSLISAAVAVFGDKLSHFSATVWIGFKNKINLMKYTAKGINATNTLVKLKQSMQIQSHYDKIKIKKIKYVYILMNMEGVH